MTAALTPVPKIQFFADDGTPLVGGKLYSYAAGTTTPLATYTTYAGTVANTNPVILDSRGEANVWLGAAQYKLALYDADNALIWTVDNIVSDDVAVNLAGPNGASLVGYTPAGAGAVATTVQTKLRESMSVTDFGAVGNGVANDATAVSIAAQAAASLSIPLAVSSKTAFTTITIPSSLKFGNVFDVANKLNLIPNGNFHTWQRADARNLTAPATFTVQPPTFGDPATYSGTGGLPLTTSDMWYGQTFGLYGTNVIARNLITCNEAKTTTGTEYSLNWQTTAVATPAAFSKTITNITTPTVATVTVTSASHGLTNGTWVWIAATYNGGLGGFVNQANEASFQISNVTTNTFDITITPDAGFISWISFASVSNDPDNTSFEHVYDASLVSANPPRRKWIRNGTASFLISCRLPAVRFGDGLYTVRLRMRRNSGNPVIRVRLGYDYGTGTTPSPTGDYVGLLAAPTTGTDIVDYLGVVDVPALDGKTFGTSGDTGYLAVTLGADPTSFNVNIYSVSLREGVASMPNDTMSKYEAYPYLRQFYQYVRVGVNVSATSGAYYGIAYSFDPPMRGTPTVTVGRSLVSLNFGTPSRSNNVTSEGFNCVAQATATAVSSWASIFECEYNIPT